MAKKQFEAESKRLLEMMINSIYTHKEIFLRELISNSSDAIDKIYYKALTDENISFNKENYYIRIEIDKNNRILKIIDTGIGMTKEELEDNLGVIAKSGTLSFKKENQLKDGYDIIGQFGVGFYSAFMVSETVIVRSKSLDSDIAYKWESNGADGYTIENCEKEEIGTEILLKIKENTEDENFDEYLDEFRIKNIIKKYSDFIRYPIKMDITQSKIKEDSDNEYEEYIEEQVVNNMIPIWRKNKNELTTDDYINFYSEKHYGFDKPLKHVHVSVDGVISYNAILFIPETIPFDYYTKEYEKGLELYSSGVLIMDKCKELLPDYFSFVKGLVDSEDFSLNISREILQHDRHLKLIGKNIKNKIKKELLKMLNDNREEYDKFYKSFGRQLKYGVYSDYGSNKEILQDLLMFYSSKEKKMVTLDEYLGNMPEDQKYIYYACGESIERIEKLPQIEMISEKGYEILYFTEDIDEFAINMLKEYKEKEFKSTSSTDLGLGEDEDNDNSDVDEKESTELFEFMKNTLNEKVKDVKASKRLKKHAVCLSNAGELTIEMEKILNTMPNNENVKAEKVLEINIDHSIYNSLKDAFEKDKEKLGLFTNLLYNQALLIEGLPIEDPVEFSNNICEIMS